MQTDDALNVWKGDGTSSRLAPDVDVQVVGNSSPVIGDVDGDGHPDIASRLLVAGLPRMVKCGSTAETAS